MPGRRGLLHALLLVVVAVALPACHADDGTTEAAASVQLSQVPDASPAVPDPAPAAPDPAPAPPDPSPAAPDPAPAPPNPSPPADPSFPLPGARAETVSPVAAACADLLDALTDAVIRYEVAALAEEAGSGSRSAAAAEMLVAIERARAAAGSQAGLPSASAPAIDAVIALRSQLDSRATLDEEDAAPWRAEREGLESWCEAQG